MNRSLSVGLLACLVVASTTAYAQRFGHERPPASGVCFYEDEDFHGDYFCVAGGGEVAAMSEDVNDKISSIKIIGGAAVTVFTDARFAGTSNRFTGDVRKLKDENWDDRISSVRVMAAGVAAAGPGDVDTIIRRAYDELLDREPDAQGFALYRNRMTREGWSEDRVRAALRTSPEFSSKGGMKATKAEEIVRRAYRVVLKREPDAAGSQGYVQKVLQAGWSQVDVERELRNSDEYKKK